MTDKQIIIDGMDCRYWFRPNPTDYRKCSLRGQDDNCDEIKDCFIKELLGKLKRKEQECEAYKMEAEKGKEINAELKATNEDLLSIQYKLADSNKQLRQTLAEIKEIANRPYLLPCGGDCKQQNCTDKTTENGKHCMELKLIQILQICDEVISE